MLKPIFLLAAAMLVFVCPGLLAQEPTSAPNPETSTAPTAAAPEGSPLFPTDAVPAGAANAPGGGGRRGGRRHGGGRRTSAHATDAATQRAANDPLQVRIDFRRVKTNVLLRNPGLEELIAEAKRAPTDEIKRSYLRQYYTQFYALVRKADPSPAMKAHVELLAAASEQRYDPKRRALNDEGELVGGGRARRRR